MRRPWWSPLCSDWTTGWPTPGDLIALEHAVWHVDRVTPIELSDADRDVWLRAGMPDPKTWKQRPYRVYVTHLGGARPKDCPPGEPVGACDITVRAGQFMRWHIYHNGRWPQCSCCGEPMPCRAELEDAAVEAAAKRLGKLEKRKPGCCWACEEPITKRQQSVVYQGENLDLPTGPAVMFHLCRSCFSSAKSYEERWLNVDPRRERILTYPKCGGKLIVHGDGSTECSTTIIGLGAELGFGSDSTPGCQGHLTHSHTWISMCIGQGTACPRGCTMENHGGTRCSPRPLRRDHPHLDQNAS